MANMPNSGVLQPDHSPNEGSFIEIKVRLQLDFVKTLVKKTRKGRFYAFFTNLKNLKVPTLRKKEDALYLLRLLLHTALDLGIAWVIYQYYPF